VPAPRRRGSDCKPWAITTQGTLPSVLAGRYSQPAHRAPADRKVTSARSFVSVIGKRSPSSSMSNLLVVSSSYLWRRPTNEPRPQHRRRAQRGQRKPHRHRGRTSSPTRHHKANPARPHHGRSAVGTGSTFPSTTRRAMHRARAQTSSFGHGRGYRAPTCANVESCVTWSRSAGTGSRSAAKRGRPS